MLLSVLVAILAAILFPHGTEAILGGEDAAEGQFPYLVSIVEIHSGIYAGAGVILNSRWILTVAQAVYNMGELRVRAGSNLINEGGQVCNVSTMVFHEDYHGSFDRYKHDVGLLRVSQDIQFSERIRPVVLATPGTYPAPDTPVFIAAWGRTVGNFSAPIKQELQLLREMYTVGEIHCHDLTGLPITGFVCAKHKSGAGTCFGDAGGVLISASTGVVLALQSYVYNPWCGNGLPDFYTDSAYYWSWIETHMVEAESFLNYP